MSTYHVCYIFHARVPFPWQTVKMFDVHLVRCVTILHSHVFRDIFVSSCVWTPIRICTRVIVRCCIYSVLDSVHCLPLDVGTFSHLLACEQRTRKRNRTCLSKDKMFTSSLLTGSQKVELEVK